MVLTLAHQYLGQLSSDLRQAVMGTAANFAALRVGAEDAPLIADHLGLAPTLQYGGMGSREISPAAHLIALPKFQAYVRVPDEPAIAGAIDIDLLAPPAPIHPHPERLISRSRSRFGRERARIEGRIARFLAPDAPTRGVV
jgi:hypothetical protein